MMANYTEMFIFFPNTLFFLKMMIEQSPSSHRHVVQSVADWLLTVPNYSELVVDQSSICRQPNAD